MEFLAGGIIGYLIGKKAQAKAPPAEIIAFEDFLFEVNRSTEILGPGDKVTVTMTKPAQPIYNGVPVSYVVELIYVKEDGARQIIEQRSIGCVCAITLPSDFVDFAPTQPMIHAGGIVVYPPIVVFDVAGVWQVQHVQ